MDTPLEIVFHNLDSSAEIESLIREQVSRLEDLYPHVIGCRVSVEMLHKQHRSGNVPEVHIALRVPGREIAISREPQKGKQRRASPSVHASIKDAFRAAEKRLKDFKQLQYGEAKSREMSLQGHVARLIAEKNYGFISTANGEELYFHRNALANDGYDALRVGEGVQYTVATGDKGRSAGRVWRTSETGSEAVRQDNALHAKR